jgi:hypothetical protein
LEEADEQEVDLQERFLPRRDWETWQGGENIDDKSLLQPNTPPPRIWISLSYLLSMKSEPTKNTRAIGTVDRMLKLLLGTWLLSQPLRAGGKS